MVGAGCCSGGMAVCGVEFHGGGGVGPSWIKLMYVVSMVPVHSSAAIVLPGWLCCAGKPCARLLGFVPVVVFVGTPLAPTAGCRVVAAPRLCEASRAEC